MLIDVPLPSSLSHNLVAGGLRHILVGESEVPLGLS